MVEAAMKSPLRGELEGKQSRARIEQDGIKENPEKCSGDVNETSPTWAANDAIQLQFTSPTPPHTLPPPLPHPLAERFRQAHTGDVATVRKDAAWSRWHAAASSFAQLDRLFSSSRQQLQPDRLFSLFRFYESSFWNRQSIQFQMTAYRRRGGVPWGEIKKW